jgi:hypothetical protein
MISVAAPKSCATQSAELSPVLVSKPVRTRIALIPALCPQWTFDLLVADHNGTAEIGLVLACAF